MAVTKTVEIHRGQKYCLVLDAGADSVEFVHEEGFEAAEDGRIEFLPSYYEEHPASGVWRSVMLRRLDASDLPVGMMIENISTRFRPRRGRQVPTQLEAIEVLRLLAHKHLPIGRAEEELFEAAPVPDPPPLEFMPELRGLNGDRVGA